MTKTILWPFLGAFLKGTTELADLSELRKKLWTSYLQNNKGLYFELLAVYRKLQVEVTRIVDAAKSETTQWERVIDIFHGRFDVPLGLGLKTKRTQFWAMRHPHFSSISGTMQSGLSEIYYLKF